jgi:hypothetical protein
MDFELFDRSYQKYCTRRFLGENIPKVVYLRPPFLGIFAPPINHLIDLQLSPLPGLATAGNQIPTVLGVRELRISNLRSTLS